MLEPVERFEVEGLTVEIHWDQDPGNPQREWDQLGTMVAFPRLAREYDIADRESTGTEDDAHERRVGLLERYLRITEGAEVVFFYFADYGSSGARLFETDDEGASGFFYVTGDKIVKEYGDDSAESREKARSCLKAEVKVMGQYVEQDVYGFVVENEDGEVLDSCWGFYGLDDDLRDEAKSSAEFYAHQRAVEVEPDFEAAIYKETR